jgi:type IX secretion system PorP/SprF family membrane protein
MTNMRKILFRILFLAFLPGLHAQQEPQMTQYMFNKVNLNPAVAGVSGAVCLTGFGRSQWIGLQDAEGNLINPQVYGITADMPIYAIKSGAGLTFQYDRLGFERNIDIKLHYAYHQIFPNNHMLSGGLALDFKHKSIDYTNLQPMGEDPSIPFGSDGSSMVTDLGLGFHYNIPRKFHAGVSVSNLLGNSSEIGGPAFDLARHYYVMAGYHIDFLDRKRQRTVVLTPGFLMKATQGSVQLDLNAIVTYNDLVWGGVFFRTERAAGLMAGITYNGVTAGVAYDYTMNNTVHGRSRSSVEFFVKYCYPIIPGVIKRSAYNTRNL